MINDDVVIFLIAPNVGEQMGGEAIKALQIFQELKKVHRHTYQITHARNVPEVRDRLKLDDVFFVEDDWLTMALWRTKVLGFLINSVFSKRAVQLAERKAQELGLADRFVILHQTEPNSPVTPRSISRRHRNVFGPINGNIYYPAIFRAHEKLQARIRRIFHMPTQRLNRLLFSDLKKADMILCAGGDRTRVSLRAAGCPEAIVRESLDCGIREELLQRPRVTHQGNNPRFLHFGRLVFHKGTALIIESLPKTRQRICLDIVGRGPELENCQALVARLGLGDRVRFLGWYESHQDLFASFHQYRGVLLPSIEDANGIVVQEAMAAGLPPICLDWGGPQLLVDDGVNGFLIEPRTRDHITDAIAARLDRLTEDAALAESMSVAARAKAEAWRWPRIIESWSGLYAQLR
ncbi:glycosyltransferase [uncultured Methylibium sp.]|uniref:glycosyltransferase n=1 Tax=uncultured Methylibium sp. TaxID=381093 RepID=UPI0025D71621|nr:glycosyltransferase [uncultured Methylibium sp.]